MSYHENKFCNIVKTNVKAMIIPLVPEYTSKKEIIVKISIKTIKPKKYRLVILIIFSKFGAITSLKRDSELSIPKVSIKAKYR